MPFKKKVTPLAFDTDYLEYETVPNDGETSESEMSEIDSEISDKNDQESISKEIEEMNNNYSFLKVNVKKKVPKKSEKPHEILKEEEYLPDQ